MDDQIHPLNPPPEPVLTWEAWYAEMERLLTDAMPLYEPAPARPEAAVIDKLLAHARKRIGP